MSSQYAEKSGEGKRNRQRSLGEGFGLSHDGAMYVAFRDAVTGLEYLHRQRDIADRGMHLSLDAYKCHVFLDWRDLHDDGSRPWGALCDMLNGRGVSSLDDALKALELKPVHDALRALLDPALIRSYAEDAAKLTRPGLEPKTATNSERPVTSKPAASPEAQAVMTLRHLVGVLFAEIRRFSATPDGEATGIVAARDWTGTAEAAIDRFHQHLLAARHLPNVTAELSPRTQGEIAAVLPVAKTTPDLSLPAWGTVVAWCALEALASVQSGKEPNPAATSDFDGLRLREPLADSFMTLGMGGEDRWRAAARIRASFAHAAWNPSLKPTAPAPALTWEHDPEIGWLIGSHDYEGVRYFNKEAFERLVWWSALPALLELLSAPKLDAEALAELQGRVQRRLDIAENSGYKVEGLLDAARLTLAKERE
jgi:hypothetical protein